jgi:hypothetical protein
MLYTVKSPLKVEKSGDISQIGEEVELTDKVAKPLLEAGIVEPAAPKQAKREEQKK